MICLDEEYIGMDPNSIIVRGLRVCGGVFCNLSNRNLLAAHFSNTVTAEEILVGCRYLMEHFSDGADVIEMYFIANLAQWQSRNDKYSNTVTLVHELKLMFQYTGAVKLSDTNIIGPAIDIRFDAGEPATISYRLTLQNEQCVITPSNNVKYIKLQTFGGVRLKTPIITAINVDRFHQIPFRVNGFIPIANSMFVSVI